MKHKTQTISIAAITSALAVVSSIAVAATWTHHGDGGWRTDDGRGGWTQKDEGFNRYDTGFEACQKLCEGDTRCQGIEYLAVKGGFDENGRRVQNKCEVHYDPFKHCDTSLNQRDDPNNGCWVKSESLPDDEEVWKSPNDLFKVPPVDRKDPQVRDQTTPKPELMELFKELQAKDGSAQVTWFHGHVDSFVAAPKATVPDYALGILGAAGINTKPQPIKRFGATTERKPGVDWDKNPAATLPVEGEKDVRTPGLTHTQPVLPDEPTGTTDAKAAVSSHTPATPTSAEPETVPATYSRVAHNVLMAFLKQHQKLFEIPTVQLGGAMPELKLVSFSKGEYYWRVIYQQQSGEGVLHNGKTVVLLDPNWNIINISRILLTPEKTADITAGNEQHQQLGKDEAVKVVLKAIQTALGSTDNAKVLETTLGLDAVRGKHVWKVRVANADTHFSDLVFSLDAASGELLNVADNVDRYTDAKVSRWGYVGGDLTDPVRYTSNNFYTRDDNTLVHDFFHVVSDNRNNGAALDSCDATPQVTETESDAYGTTNGSNYIRPTRRSDRDFSLWWPSEASGTFGEAHTYYWARWFMQWMKPAFKDLGVLPANAANYPKALLIANACEDGVGVHSSSFAVTTLNNVGEGVNTIRLPERCRSANSNCAEGDYASSNSGSTYTYEGSAGYSTPGVIHHELNHFIMKRYFNIGSGLDCGAGEQLKFLHEGAAGRSLPQAYWHHYYGSGYAPANQNRNYRHNEVAGRPHTDNASLNKLSDFLCADEPSAYEGGSVVHQAMWKFYHGVAVNGSTQVPIARVSTDKDFLVLYYWAMDLVAASTYQDRYEMANRVMQIMENHSNLSSSGKRDWCDVWEVHGLDDFISSSYCS